MQNDALSKGMIVLGIGIAGILYDWLKFSMQPENKKGFARTRLIWGSYLAVAIGILLVIMGVIEASSP
jgi:hypothetical protein